MSQIISIGSYTPPWTDGKRPVRGPDEDAVTMAVAAGRAADPRASASRVVVISRDLPLLEGGGGAPLLAGLSLDAQTPVTEILGAGPQTLAQIAAARPGTLVIAVDDNDTTAGAGAVLTGDTGGLTVQELAGQTRSLPVRTRDAGGHSHDYADPRLDRELGAGATLARLRDRLDPGSPVVGLVGVTTKQVPTTGAPTVRRSSASGVVEVLAAVAESDSPGSVIALEQATAFAASVVPGTAPEITRDAADPAPTALVPVLRGHRDTDLPGRLRPRLRRQTVLAGRGHRRSRHSADPAACGGRRRRDPHPAR